MAYESAGIRFTEGPQGNRPAAQTPVQEAIQLLRLRVPKFSGAQSPVAPQLMAGGPQPMMPTSAPMMQQLQPLLQALSGGAPPPDATNRPTFTGAQPTRQPQPNAALIQQLLRQIIESQQRQFLPEGGGSLNLTPQFQYGTSRTPPTSPAPPAPTPPAFGAPPPGATAQPVIPNVQPGPGFSGFGGQFGY